MSTFITTIFVSRATTWRLSFLLVLLRHLTVRLLCVGSDWVRFIASVARPTSHASPRPISADAKSSVAVLVFGDPLIEHLTAWVGPPALPDALFYATIVLAQMT